MKKLLEKLYDWISFQLFGLQIGDVADFETETFCNQ
jgi:hypothetical protein